MYQRFYLFSIINLLAEEMRCDRDNQSYYRDNGSNQTHFFQFNVVRNRTYCLKNITEYANQRFSKQHVENDRKSKDDENL